ncbi:MAG: hypothetical protein IK081_14015 [Lachnospiraceae bacterium]|nr:hypothetical protein [Lachnospiraceae bacterium]
MANPPGVNKGNSCAYTPIVWGPNGRARDNTLFVAPEEEEGIFYVGFDIDEIREYRDREDIGKYVSRGFVSCKKKNVSGFQKGNFPTSLLVCELVPGALDGKEWTYFPSTAADCCNDTAAVEAFDQDFPPKEKKWMPSQEEFYIYRNSSVVRG